MQSPARPIGQSLLKIGIGLSSIATALCPSAIAAPLPVTQKALPTLSQTISTDSPKAHPPLTVLSPHSSTLNIQPPPPLLYSAVELTPTPKQGSNVKPEQNTALIQAQPETQMCQSLQDCDRAFTTAIDAAGATTLEKLAEAPSNPKANAPEIETGAIETPIAPLPAVATQILEPRTNQKPSYQPTNKLAEQARPLSSGKKDETQREDRESAGSLDDLIEAQPRRNDQPQVDDELGRIIVNPLRSRGDEDLGILRLLQRAAAPPRPKVPIAFLTGRLGYFNSENALRLDNRKSDQIYQSGISFAAFPSLSENTSLYVIAETNLGRSEQAGDRGYNEIELQAGIPVSNRGYNEIELQAGVRQKLFPRTYAQIGVRNQRLYSFGYEQKILGINYIDAVISHRSIFNSRTWLDSFYQAKLGFADNERASRFRQTLTLSLNYAVNKDIRTSLLYQLDLEDYTQVSRYDVYQQVIGTVSYRLTPESRISVFGGTRFGSSSGSDSMVSGMNINLDDTFYGAGLVINLPLF